MSLVSVTEAAAAQIKRLLDQEGKATSHALRMKVVGGGCSGLQYQLMFDDQAKPNDHEVDASGVRVVVDEKSALYLVGTTLDYVDTLMESGFKIQNPNAKAWRYTNFIEPANAVMRSASRSSNSAARSAFSRVTTGCCGGSTVTAWVPPVELR